MTNLPAWLREIEEGLTRDPWSLESNRMVAKDLLATLKRVWVECIRVDEHNSAMSDAAMVAFTIQQFIENGGEEEQSVRAAAEGGEVIA